MKHHISPEDDRFRSAFEALQIDPGQFGRRAVLSGGSESIR